MANDAVSVNDYDGATQDLTVRGSDWLWAAFSIMMLSNLVLFGWHLTIPRGQRIFHQLGLIVLTTASIAYFGLASNLGKTPVPIEFSHANGFPLGTTRSLWYVRYIDWVITTPALLLELTLASGLPLSDIIALTFFDVVMIITGLVGGLIPSSYKWGFWTFGMFALFYIWWVLAGPARQSAKMLGGGYQSAFTKSAIFLSFLWLLYPIAWGLADGGNVITTDSEMVFYGILDILAKPVFLFFHLWLLSKEDLSVLQLSSGKITELSYDREKHMPATAGSPTTFTSHSGKGGMFGRRGRFDADHPASTTAPVTTAPAAVAHDNGTAPPRMSEATVTSQ